MTIATIGQIILVMLLWAACFPLITAGIEFAPHLTFASLRAILAGLTLTGLALATRRPFPTDKRVGGGGHQTDWTGDLSLDLSLRPRHSDQRECNLEIPIDNEPPQNPR